MRVLVMIIWLASACLSVHAQSLMQTSLPAQLTRAQFMKDGYAGSVALVGGNVTSEGDARTSDNLFPLSNGSCYRILGDKRISPTGRLYFAINHKLSQPNYRNAFVAAQVIRFVPAQASTSNVAVTRNPGKWLDLKTGKPIGGLQSDPLAITIDEFVAAHTLINGKFDVARIQRLFDSQGITFHAKLAQISANQKSVGSYSSLDPGLAPEWIELGSNYRPANSAFAVYMRNYLISLHFNSKAVEPIVFYTDPIQSKHVLVRLSDSIGSGFGDVSRTFELALNDDCLFVPQGGGLFSAVWSRFRSGRN